MSLIYFRECIVPEVSRAVLTTKSQFWDVTGLEGKLGGSHALNTQQGVKIKDIDKWVDLFSFYGMGGGASP